MDPKDILFKAYQDFTLNFGGTKVATPYRINIPYQPDLRKYGKSEPDTLQNTALEIAKEQGVNLEGLNSDEIRKFMEENMLGIDCSGFVYVMLDQLLKKQGSSMQEKGFPKISSTNVEKLTSEEFSTKVNSISRAQAGDMIKLNSTKEVPHILIVLDNFEEEIIYAHSSSLTPIKGVHSDKIIDAKFPRELEAYSYNEEEGDGVYRLK